MTREPPTAAPCSCPRSDDQRVGQRRGYLNAASGNRQHLIDQLAADGGGSARQVAQLDAAQPRPRRHRRPWRKEAGRRVSRAEAFGHGRRATATARPGADERPSRPPARPRPRRAGRRTAARAGRRRSEAPRHQHPPTATALPPWRRQLRPPPSVPVVSTRCSPRSPGPSSASPTSMGRRRTGLLRLLGLHAVRLGPARWSPPALLRRAVLGHDAHLRSPRSSRAISFSTEAPIHTWRCMSAVARSSTLRAPAASSDTTASTTGARRDGGRSRGFRRSLPEDRAVGLRRGKPPVVRSPSTPIASRSNRSPSSRVSTRMPPVPSDRAIASYSASRTRRAPSPLRPAPDVAWTRPGSRRTA